MLHFLIFFMGATFCTQGLLFATNLGTDPAVTSIETLDCSI